MRNTLRSLLALGTIIAATMVATPAQAASISPGYCGGDSTFVGSLRGGGTLAPDNDILAKWRDLQAAGYTVQNSRWDHYKYGLYGADIIYMYWIYATTSGNRYGIFACWRDGSSVFHDGFIQWGWSF